jgi:membrane associated rhomboid family serine protease
MFCYYMWQALSTAGGAESTIGYAAHAGGALVGKVSFVHIVIYVLLLHVADTQQVEQRVQLVTRHMQAMRLPV